MIADGTTVMLVMIIVLRTTGMLAMTVIAEMIVEMIAPPTAEIDLGPQQPDVVATTTIVGPPGLPLPGGKLMREGLQGTMIGGVAMMTVEALTLIMTAVGMTKDATRRTTGLTTGHRGIPMGIAVGRVEEAMTFWMSSEC